MSDGRRDREDSAARPSQPGGRLGPPAPDIIAILAALVDHQVAFVVIGGVAVAHHGYVRATKDVDIVPAPDEQNLRKLWDALTEMEAQPLSLGEFRPEELPPPFTFAGLLEHGNWDLSTKYGRIDLLQYIFGKLESPEDYEALADGAVSGSFPFGNVLFSGFEDLIDLKNLAGRDQDLTDIRALREARGETGPE